MEPRPVALVDLGESLSIDLEDLASTLNNIQQGFEFNAAGSITLEAVGDPDVEDVWYSTGYLFGVLETRVHLEDFDLVVGLTHLPLARTDSAGTVIDKNYFSLSDLGKLSLVSTHANVMAFKSEWKTEDQYVAYLIAGELLINLAGQDLMHLLANNCLFDDCVDRTRLAQCMNKSHICI